MNHDNHIQQAEAWKNKRYSSIFTRSNFSRLLKNNDYSLLNSVIKEYDIDKIGNKIDTYEDYLKYTYKFMIKKYRNEYVYKNSLINLILKKYGTKNTVAFNEFRVGNSIADIVMFNGISRAFEIKTELDTDKRLKSQLADYKRIFKQSFIVIHESLIDKYKDIDNEIGIIVLSINRGNVKLDILREAENNYIIDPYILIRSLRAEEYKDLIKRYYGYLPSMNAFSAFKICEKMILNIPSSELHQLFTLEMKHRKTNMKLMPEYNSYLRQMCLSMHISKKEYIQIENLLKNNINI
jgi:hypothetical protein